MLHKEFVPYAESLELKAIGFNEPCFGYYIELRNPSEGILTIDKCENNIDGVLAPTFSQAFRFFREKYGYDVSIIRRTINAYKFEINLLSVEDDYHFIDFSFNTYEDAELVCLRKLIEIVKNK